MTESASGMTPAERALWKQARADYQHALAVTLEAWKDVEFPVATAEATQAGAATVLIHITKLRESSHRGMAPHAAPAAVKRDGSSPATSQASAAVPPCHKCGGAMDDVRGSKRGEKSPDFVCRQEKGDCGKPNKDKTKWFPTAAWLEKSNGANAKPNALVGRTDAASFDEPPAGFLDGTDDLPF